MRYPVLFLALALSSRSYAQAVSDVPTSHWAASAVSAVVSRGVMDAPGGKFDGNRVVTRREMIKVLLKLSGTFDQQKWVNADAKPIKSPTIVGNWKNRPITRFELAGSIYFAGSYVGRAGIKPVGRPTPVSESFTLAQSLGSTPASDPSFADLNALMKLRALTADSVLLRPGNEPITTEQAARLLARTAAAFINRVSDEPQNREEIPEFQPQPKKP